MQTTLTSNYITLFNAYCIVVDILIERKDRNCLIHLSVCVYPTIQGGKEFLMRAHFGLPSVEKDELEGKPPITVKFEIPYFTVSGIQVCMCAWAYMSVCLCFNVKQPKNTARGSMSQDHLMTKHIYSGSEACHSMLMSCLYVNTCSFKALTITREDHCFAVGVYTSQAVESQVSSCKS